MFPDLVTFWGTLLYGYAIASDPAFITDAMSDETIRQWRDVRRAELERQARKSEPKKTPKGTTHPFFYCTVYFTPMESGFTAERGFDATPATAPGLGDRTYPVSFLAAVKKEGFGRLIEPVNERNYLQYAGNGKYQFAKTPLGRRGEPLVPRKSCAISKRNPHLRHGMLLQIESGTTEAVFENRDWEATDTGGGLHPLQIDLYWGEDEPMGAVGRQQARPAGTRLEYLFDATVLVAEEKK